MFRRNIANAVTCLNLACGSLACIAAPAGANGPWWGLTGIQWAWILIGAAAVFDFADGFVARLLDTTSAIGKELDSLCDCVSFGLAPALTLYAILAATGAPAWVTFTVIFIPVMGAVRLARFNIDTRQTTTFIGLPIPASAIFWTGAGAWILKHGYPGNGIVLTLIVVMSLFMVSPLRMFSLKFKNLSIRDNFRRYVIILAAIIFVITDGVPGLAWLILLYLLISIFGRKNMA